MINKKANALISWIMIVTLALISALMTAHMPFQPFAQTIDAQKEEILIKKRIENFKKIFMQKGIYAIEEFFNPNSANYFGIKMNSFFEETNLIRVKSMIEAQAAAQGKSTKDVMNELMAGEFVRQVFGGLEQELKNIASNYRSKIKIERNMTVNISKLDTALASANGIISTIGVSTAVLAAYGALTAKVTGLWMALVVWWSGASVGWAGATTAIVSGPWGWIALLCAVTAIYYGHDYYKKDAERQIREIKEDLTVEVKSMKQMMINNWNGMF